MKSRSLISLVWLLTLTGAEDHLQGLVRIGRKLKEV